MARSIRSEGGSHTAVVRRWAPAAVATLAAVAAVVATLVGPSLAGQPPSFPDVPPGSFFHEPVEAIAAAGCATGFNDGEFKPNRATTRGQFALWMNRCGSRVEYDRGAFTAHNGASSTSLAEVAITAGAEAGSGGSVLLQGEVFSEVTCASVGCFLPIELYDVTGSAVLERRFLTVPASGAVDSVSIQVVIPLEPGERRQLRLRFPASSGTQAEGQGSLVATYHPFQGDGAGGPAAYEPFVPNA